jgi:hypothetical protein
LLGLLGVLTTSWMLLLGAGPAQAHDALRGTDPAAGSTLTTTPTAVKLTFTEPVLDGTAKVQVTGPNGVATTGDVASKGATVAAGLLPGLPDGAYTVLWRVTSTDGHPVSGKFSFTLSATPPGPPTPNKQPLPTPAADASRVPVAVSPTAAPSSAAAALDTTPVPPASTPAPSTTPIIVAVVLTGLVAGGAWWAIDRRRRQGS